MKNTNFAGEVDFNYAQIISTDNKMFDILGQVISIQFFEEIHTPFIHGSIILKDSVDNINLIPMLGQEMLNIKISTPALEDKNGTIETTFYIYRVKNREILGDRSVTYTLDFISKEGITDSNIKLSRGFKGKISDIAKTILTDKTVQFDINKKLNIEETKNDTIYVSNYWSPAKNMTYLSNMAINTNSSPSYTFFENRNGFNFASIESMLNKTDIQQFRYVQKTKQYINPKQFVNNIEDNYKKIESIRVTNGINTLERMRGGLLSSVAFINDIVSKRFNVNYYDHEVGFNNTKHLNEFPLLNKNFPIEPTAKILNLSKSAFTFDKIYDTTSSNYVQRRIYELYEKSDFVVEIEVLGRFDYTVGEVVYLDLTKYCTSSNPDMTDYIFSGRYLIVAINHFITTTSHKCTIELNKDSYIKNFTKTQ